MTKRIRLIVLLLSLVFFSFTALSQSANREKLSETKSETKETNLIMVVFEEEPSLEIALLQPITTNVSAPYKYEGVGRLTRPLVSDNGEVILKAGKEIPLAIQITPGRIMGAAGEAVVSIKPFVIGGRNETAPQMVITDNKEETEVQKLLTQYSWKITFSSNLDSAMTPEMAGAKFFIVRKGNESLRGTRSSRAPQAFDQGGMTLDYRLQAAANRSLVAGVTYDIATAIIGTTRLLFSRRNLYLPVDTHLYFKLGKIAKLRKINGVENAVQLLP